MKGKKGVYESPQAAPEGTATKGYGGMAPDGKDVQKSANARSKKRHAVLSPSDNEADSVLPTSGGEALEKSGVHNTGYITKKATPWGVEAMFNSLPPGMDINDQELIDAREMELKNYAGGLSYPGDGAF